MALHYLCLLTLCFIGFHHNLFAQQEEDKLLADQYYKKAKQLGDANVLDSSIYYYQKALTIYEELEDWRGYIICCNGLGACYTLLLDLEPAKEYLDKGFSKIDLLNAKNDMDSIIAEHYLQTGFYHGKLGDIEKQFIAYEKSLDIGIKVLGSEHQKVAEYHNNLGVSYLNKGNYEKALFHFKKSLEIFENDNIFLLYVYNNLGVIYQKQGDFDNAIRFFQKSENIAAQDANRQVEVALSYNNIGQVYEIKGDFNLANNYFQKALNVLFSIFGSDNIYTAVINNNIAKLSLKQGKYDEALAYFTKAQNVVIETAGNLHPYVASTHSNIGQCYDKKGQHEENLKHLNVTLSIQQKILPPNHPDLASTHNNLGVCYFKMGEMRTSLNHFQEAVSILVPEFDHTDFYANPSLDGGIGSKPILLEVLKNKAKTLEKLQKDEHSEITALEHALLVVFQRV